MVSADKLICAALGLLFVLVIAAGSADARKIVDDEDERLLKELLLGSKIRQRSYEEEYNRQQLREILQQILRSRNNRLSTVTDDDDVYDNDRSGDVVLKRQQNWVNFGDSALAKARENKKVVFDSSVGR